jgi:predicted membrane-bound dolichyl-phosphate-mannose-protein mannosyltransferase
MAALTKGKVGGDVLQDMYHPQYCLEEKDVTNGGGSAITLTAGYPMDDNVPVLNATQGNTDGFVVQEVTIAAGKTAKVPVLVRGPGVINITAMPVLDTAGAALVVATYVAAFQAATSVVLAEVIEPVKQEEQTT